MKITLIFDQFGNPNQPFWLSFYRRLIKHPDIDLKVFTAKQSSNSVSGVLFLKSRTYTDKIIAGFRYYLNYRKANKDTFREFVRYPDLCMDTNRIIHVLNAQQYPSFKSCVRGKRLIFSFRGYETMVRPLVDEEWKASLTNIFSDASVLHFVSHHICDKAIGMGVDPEKCQVIYRSVDLNFFKPTIDYNLKNKPIQILTVGRLTWQKGYSNALESIRNLLDLGYDIQYHIMGEGPDLQQLYFHRERLGLIEKVYFHGLKNREQIREAFENASIYFHPAVTDAMPNSVLEASSMALPVVATTAGGIPEAVINNKTGLLAPIADTRELTKHLVSLIEDQELARTMGLAGRQHITERFGQEREMTEWLSLYRRLEY